VLNQPGLGINYRFAEGLLLFTKCIALTCHSLGKGEVQKLISEKAEGVMRMFELTFDRLDDKRNLQLLYGCPGFSEHTDKRSFCNGNYIEESR